MKGVKHTRTMKIDSDVVAFDEDVLPVGKTLISIEDEVKVTANVGDGPTTERVIEIVHKFDPPLSVPGEVIDR